ncbi:MAG: hypothetical protein QT08_C0016G0014 [archaeon GW2011_AR17]|nr:MAG: hypothetical protein QT08_C0016G0014 [archaeon GW2011_AR17]MBS3154694.1 hypothetical protein [Candidatus Woesearchaeota archaeon]HIH14981.1 hypothetical protein [Nanoarchaeota archaeon]HIH58786.1 hypothetical protein [Nanoarchaeota archaeon]HII13517.1 hypothetical protein [Nanoarchaeota archaeon]
MIRQIDRYNSTRQILCDIGRYRRKKTMFYRSNVALHEQRVLALAREIYPFTEKCGLNLRRNLLETFAEIHDDFELTSYNVPKNHLEKGDSKAREQLRALHALNGSYDFTRRGYEAKPTLIRFKIKNDIEAKFVDYLNIFNGFAEAIHEIAAGNDCFLDVPTAHRERLLELGCENHELWSLYDKNHPLFEIPEFDPNLLPGIVFHTTASITKDTGYAPYDFWKRALIMKGNVETFESLFRQREGKKKEVRGLLTMACN